LVERVKIVAAASTAPIKYTGTGTPNRNPVPSARNAGAKPKISCPPMK
jgi:hypothetical protein